MAKAAPKGKGLLASLKPVVVVWEDATGSDAAVVWHELSTARRAKLVEVVTSGFLIRETKKHLVIAGSVTSAGHVADVCVIPKGGIKRRHG